MTDIAHTPVKGQSIGNCWSYAVLGWVESQRLAHDGEVLDLSESYISYWRWFDQIAGGEVDESSVASSGTYGIAAELMLRYGVIEEHVFIPEEGSVTRSSRQKTALAAIEASLESGVLATAETRSDRALVRAELDRAFQLKPEISTLLDDAFGPDVTRNFTDGASALAPILRAADLELGDGITLADRLGTHNPLGDLSQRSGPFAWSQTRYPSKTSPPFAGDIDLRRWLARLQRAVHDGQPVMISWFVDFNALEEGAFREPPETMGRQGGHQVLLEDYEIENVPGYGTLRAGDTITDANALEAALDDDARITFLRVKNSWGDAPDPSGTGEHRGYLDIYLRYLDGPVPRCTAREPGPGPEASRRCTSVARDKALNSAVLPPGY